MRFDDCGFPARRIGADAENVIWEEVGGSGSPGVVPVLVGLVLLIPSFPGDCGAAVDHVPPAAVVGGEDEVEGGCGLAVLE